MRNFFRMGWVILIIVWGVLSERPTVTVAADPPILITPDPGVKPVQSSNVKTNASGGSPSGEAGAVRVPTPLEQSKARKVIEHAFREEYDRRNSKEGKLELAITLLNRGRETEDDLTGRYVMLREARDLGIELGETSFVMEAIDEMADSHRISRVDEKLIALKKLEKTVRGSDGQAGLCRVAVRGILESIRHDDFLTARQFQQIAEVAARRSQIRELNELVKVRVNELTGLQGEYARVSAALNVLKENPKDPTANLEVGKYYAISLGEWARGLPYLSQSNESTLRSLATLELQAPQDPLKQLEVADGWWNWGSQLLEGSLQRKHVLRHAIEWYRRVHPQLQGLTESRVFRLLQDFQSFPEKMSFEEQEELSEIVYLSDLAPTSVDVVRQAFGTGGRRDGGDPIRLKGRWLHKGLCTPPAARGTSSVVYELPETTYQFFRTTVGVDDAVGNRLKSPLVFEVWGDYQLLWKSDPITRSGIQQTCRVKVLTVKRLELRVVCSGSDEYAWPIWGDPRLMMR